VEGRRPGASGLGEGDQGHLHGSALLRTGSIERRNVMNTMTCKKEDTTHCFVFEGKMALPNQYFVGRLGSKFIIALRDRKKVMGLRGASGEKTFEPPRGYCHICQTKIDENWVALGSEGERVNGTIVRSPGRRRSKRVPYSLGQIKLEGADTPLTHIVE